MANFLLSYVNWIDRAETALTASHEAATLPASNLRADNILKTWRSVGSTTPWLRADFGQARAMRVLGLFGLARCASSDTIRWRLGTAAGAGDVYDSGAIACGRYPGFAQSLHCLPAALSARHLQIDLSAPSQSGVGYVDAGRLWAGDAWQGSRNYSYGAFADIDDGQSRQAPSDRAPATAIFIDPRGPAHVAGFDLDALTPAEKWTVLEIKRVVGRKRQLVYVPDPDSADLQREALLGLIEESGAVRQPNFPTRATSFRLRGPFLEED